MKIFFMMMYMLIQMVDLIFICKSEPSDIYKYIFHIFIKSDFNNINLKFIINNKDFTYDIYVDKLKYL